MTTLTAKRCYVAGPMRGYPMHNFPMFDEVSEELRKNGWDVVSPAEMDREHGYDGSRPPTEEELVEMLERDFEAIGTVSAIVLLPGWEQSEGVAMELTVAKGLKPQPSVAIYVRANKSLEWMRWDSTGQLVTL